MAPQRQENGVTEQELEQAGGFILGQGQNLLKPVLHTGVSRILQRFVAGEGYC